MGLEYVDIFYSHRPDPETPVEETMAALDQAVRSGKALYVGLSNYNASQTAAAVKILRELGTPCLIHQMKYSIFQRALEQGLLDVLGKEGVGAIAFCPLAQGLLTDRYLKGIPADSRATKEKFLKTSDIDERRRKQIRALHSLAAQRGQSLAQMALAWVLLRMTSALIGASRVEQIEQNVAALANLNFTAEELTRIDAIVNEAS
jgi:L-glyceraldehyde 3-phosphate reductase